MVFPFSFSAEGWRVRHNDGVEVVRAGEMGRDGRNERRERRGKETKGVGGVAME